MPQQQITFNKKEKLSKESEQKIFDILLKEGAEIIILNYTTEIEKEDKK